jgi:lipid-A-disaccharide synthase
MAEQRRKPGRLVTILPGSRNQELTNNFHWFLKAAQLVRQQVPDARFAVAAFKPQHAARAESLSRQTKLPIEVHAGRTPELMAAAHCCMATSGSVSLELLYHARPTAILYWLPYWTYMAGRLLVKAPYITLVNLLVAEDLAPPNPQPYDPDGPDADKVLFPEYPTWQDRSPQIARHIIQWLTDDTAYRQLVARLEGLKAKVSHGGASQRAAAYVLRELAALPQRVVRPHYQPKTQDAQIKVA